MHLMRQVEKLETEAEQVGNLPMFQKAQAAERLVFKSIQILRQLAERAEETQERLDNWDKNYFGTKPGPIGETD